MKRKILVTGATGNVGREVVRFLLEKHAGATSVYAAVTDAAKGRAALPWPAVTLVPFDFEAAATVPPAFAGMESVFLLRPPHLADVDKYFRPVVEAARTAGVRHVVFLSLQGAENNTFTPHHKIERLLAASGLAYTFLRPSFFMQNLTTTHRREIAEHNEIYIPAGRGKTNFVDARDLGEVAALVLAEGAKHHGEAYELTGARAYGYAEIAEIISRATGKPVVYRRPSALAFLWRTWRRDKTPLAFALVMAALYTVARLGKAAGYSAQLQTLLGRPPTSFDTFAREHAALWR